MMVCHSIRPYRICLCRSIENIVEYFYSLDDISFPSGRRHQCRRKAAVCPVHGIIVNLHSYGTIFSCRHSDNRCSGIESVIDADIISCNIVYGCSRPRAEHQETAQIVMAVIVFVYTVLYAIIKIKRHAVISNLRTF